ncbi:hypothetical protein [Psychrobacter glacincola]|uniref:hypothetical protein n=1 Tax=Psychrobacter glacincola TaxID=56810 RepID=UPI003CFF86D6
MIDTWFKKDLSRIHEKHPVVVFIDESGDAEFLLKSLGSDSTIYRTSGELDELEAKYKIEKSLQQNSMSDQKFVIYTHV